MFWRRYRERRRQEWEATFARVRAIADAVQMNLERLGCSPQEIKAMECPMYNAERRMHPDYPNGFPDWDPPKEQ